MALDSYSALKTSIASWLNRSDLTAVIPDFITLAEAQIKRRLIKDGPVRQMMGRGEITVADEYVEVPEGFLGIRAITLEGIYWPLQFIEPEKLADRKIAFPAQGGNPTHFSIVGDEYRLWPWNGGSFTGEQTYWQEFPALSDSATTNWLLEKHPDIYLYTSLIQSAPYLADDARLAVWGNMADVAMNDLIQADKVSRFAPDMGLPQHVYGAP